jgi:hypothetical protein
MGNCLWGGVEKNEELLVLAVVVGVKGIWLRVMQSRCHLGMRGVGVGVRAAQRA